MLAKTKNEKPVKEFMKSKVKLVLPNVNIINPTQPSSGTLEEHIVIGHSRNSRKQHFFQGSRD